MSDNENEEKIVESDTEDETPALQEKSKIKKERTPKQIEAFEKCKQKRIQNAAIKNAKIAEIKESARKMEYVEEKKKPYVPKSKPIPEVLDETDDEQEEIIIKKKTKKPKKRIVYLEESSDSEPEIVVKKAPKKVKTPAPVPRAAAPEPPKFLMKFV